MITDEMIKEAVFTELGWSTDIELDAFEAGAKWMQANCPQWVKSSDRLPTKKGTYHVKNFAGNPSTEFFNGKDIDWSAIEWLFEPQQK